ncbi:short-chain dehydrogenase [Colletotrichum sojae]|uniref:Short-chain dehydrogenase n=1 Tax=Colletotrichum sojae TaxID=2175907 RepID=A0A8H6IW80_9PEZI|nr:short-chain dehydrogenase [Colletotrichum sojae]
MPQCKDKEDQGPGITSRLRNAFPPKPTFTEADVPDQSNKVFMVTGGSGGLGKELAKMLYEKNAKVYIAARSEDKSTSTIAEIKALHPHSRGQLIFLRLDLNDLSTIERSTREFLSKENRLDVLWNNAGVMTPPQGSKTAQGYELQLGVNALAPFLFTHFLRPALAAAGSARVIWVASSAAFFAPTPAIDFGNMDYAKDESPMDKYARSKAGTILLATEFARRNAADGIFSISLDPGISLTDLQRTFTGFQKLVARIIAQEPKNCAYTELFAGLSPDVTEKNSGGWIVPFGRLEKGRVDIWDEELAKKYWEWTMGELRPYLA